MQQQSYNTTKAAAGVQVAPEQQEPRELNLVSKHADPELCTRRRRRS